MYAINTNLRCNEQIRISPIRVIGPENEQLGILPNYEALRMAREQGFDLVEVAPNVRPPVCRIMDYGKWKYAQKKGQKKHHEQLLKEIRLRPKTDDHDREIKVQRAIDFLKHGDKVQFTMVFRGRERSHREIGLESFREIVELLGDIAKVERSPIMDGRSMVMIVVPSKPTEGGAPEAGEKRERPAAPAAGAPATVRTAPAPQAATAAQPSPEPAAASAPQRSPQAPSTV